MERLRFFDRSKDDVQIRELQRNIEKRREMPVLEMNSVHKRRSKALSEEYEQISHNPR